MKKEELGKRKILSEIWHVFYWFFLRLKLKVENTIRWREVFDKDGNVERESNARFIKWSDGSFSLHLGSEIFDVYKQPLQVRFMLIVPVTVSWSLLCL